MNVYDFNVMGRDGEDISLSDYKGKVLLIVNTATECGFTGQYKDLQDLYALHNKDGFEILDFPCNQFGQQANGSDEEIHRFCESKFGISFPQFAKVDVIGENALPLFKWLSDNTKFEGLKGVMGMIVARAVKKQDKDYKKNGKIKWNFTKFLIDRSGHIVARFEPTVSMKEIKKEVEKAL